MTLSHPLALQYRRQQPYMKQTRNNLADENAWREGSDGERSTVVVEVVMVMMVVQRMQRKVVVKVMVVIDALFCVCVRERQSLIYCLTSPWIDT